MRLDGFSFPQVFKPNLKHHAMFFPHYLQSQLFPNSKKFDPHFALPLQHWDKFHAIAMRLVCLTFSRIHLIVAWRLIFLAFLASDFYMIGRDSWFHDETPYSIARCPKCIIQPQLTQNISRTLLQSNSIDYSQIQNELKRTSYCHISERYFLTFSQHFNLQPQYRGSKKVTDQDLNF